MNLFLLLTFVGILSVNCFRFPKVNGKAIKTKKELIKFDQDKDIYVTINHSNKLFNKISGTFVQIGSNPKYVDDIETHHIFDGDGIVNAVFFKNGKIIFRNHIVKTKRFLTEQKLNKKVYLNLGELRGIDGFFKVVKHFILEYLSLIPKATGTANTALLNWNNKIYALHECDLPYELEFDFENGIIETKDQINLPNIKSVTAHPKVDKIKKELYLYTYNNYDFSEGKFFYNVLDSDMKIKKQLNHSLINNGIIHDIGQTKDHFIIPDLPLKYDSNLMLYGKIPLSFDKSGITRFGVINKNSPEEIDWYYSEKNIFLFHFSKSYETKNNFIIYSCNSKEMDMMNLLSNKNMTGNIRLQKNVLNKKNKTVQIIKNKYLQNLEEFYDIDYQYNLDFPFYKKGSKYIYSCIFNTFSNKITGLIKINSHTFITSKPDVFLFKDKYLCSEPQIITIGIEDYVISFTYDESNKSYVSLIDMENKKIHDIELPYNVPKAFHSLFINKN